MNAPNPSLSAELGAMLHWWQLAGVDHDYTDDATDWLQDVAVADAGTNPAKRDGSAKTNAPRTPEVKSEKVVKRADLLGDSPPATLEEFRTWWLETPGLDTIGPRGRVAPRGLASPELMVLTIDPEQSDTDQLLGGVQGRLLSQMLRAMGIAEDATYFASALPRHTPMADTQSLASGGLDAVTLHHLKLVSPQKLVVFGSSILPLIGKDVSNSDKSLREINQDPRNVPLLMSEGLDSLMAMPRLKARFWRRWIEWSAE